MKEEMSNIVLCMVMFLSCFILLLHFVLFCLSTFIAMSTAFAASFEIAHMCLAYSSLTNCSYFFDFSYRVIVCLVCFVFVYFVDFVVEKLLLKQFGYFVSQFGSFSFFVFSCGHGSNVLSFCLHVVLVVVVVFLHGCSYVLLIIFLTPDVNLSGVFL